MFLYKVKFEFLAIIFSERKYLVSGRRGEMVSEAL